jgi:CBS domain-containing protein
MQQLPHPLAGQQQPIAGVPEGDELARATRLQAKKQVSASLEPILWRTTVRDVVGDPSFALVQLDASMPLSAALKRLAHENILSAPVWDNGRWAGFVDVIDIMAFAIQLSIPLEEREFRHLATPDDWIRFFKDQQRVRQFGDRFFNAPLGDVLHASGRATFSPVHGDTPLYQVLDSVFAIGIHRAPVTEETKSIITNLISQSDVVNWLLRNQILLGDLPFRTLKELNLGITEVVKVTPDQPAGLAFELMHKLGVSAVAVIHPKTGSLIGNLSASDIRGLSTADAGSLALPIMDFLMQRKAKLRPPVTVTPSTPFEVVLSKLALYRIHRVWIVDEKEHPIGVVSLTNVARLLVGQEY